MNGFQIFGITLSSLFMLIVLTGLFRRRIGLRSALFWLAIWIGAAITIANPETTRIVAQTLGITRGADLVFYCAILAGTVGFFLVYAKLRRLEQAVTRVVRDLASETAREPGDDATLG